LEGVEISALSELLVDLVELFPHSGPSFGEGISFPVMNLNAQFVCKTLMNV